MSARISQSMCTVLLQGLLSQEPGSGKWAGMDPFVPQMDAMVTATHKGGGRCLRPQVKHLPGTACPDITVK